jgi:hypothetical protein
MPKFFTKSLEIEDRKRLSLLNNLGENMNYLLRDGPMFLASPGLDFTIEAIGHVLNIQGSHVSSIMPPLWRNLQNRSSQRCGGRGVSRIDQRRVHLSELRVSAVEKEFVISSPRR